MLLFKKLNMENHIQIGLLSVFLQLQWHSCTVLSEFVWNTTMHNLWISMWSSKWSSELIWSHWQMRVTEWWNDESICCLKEAVNEFILDCQKNTWSYLNLWQNFHLQWGVQIFLIGHTYCIEWNCIIFI